MARGQKRSNDELLVSIDKEILEMNSRKSKIEATIRELEKKKQGIFEERRKEEAEKLLSIIEDSGMSIDDIKSLLFNKTTTV